MSIEQILWYSAIVVVFLIAIKLLAHIGYYLFRLIFPLPETRFGFRGKLVYTDNSPDAKVFVNHKYELSAKPDFIFKTALNKYVIVEFKSRNSTVRDSDLAQLMATCLAVRSTMNVVGGYVVTSMESRYFKFGSNRSVYKRIRPLHRQAKSIKYLGKPPTYSFSDKCKMCGYQNHCRPRA